MLNLFTRIKQWIKKYRTKRALKKMIKQGRHFNYHWTISDYKIVRESGSQ